MYYLKQIPFDLSSFWNFSLGSLHLYIFTYIVFRSKSKSCQLLVETFSNLLKWAHCPIHPYILASLSETVFWNPVCRLHWNAILTKEQELNDHHFVPLTRTGPAQCFMNGFHNEWVWAGRLNISWAPCWEPLSEWQWEGCCWLLTALGIR